MCRSKEQPSNLRKLQAFHEAYQRKNIEMCELHLPLKTISFK